MSARLGDGLLIVLLSVAAAVVFGVLHDQVTARVCVEYFTIGHPPLFHTDSPSLLAIGWGIVATWWAGLLVGVPAAVAAQVGSRPRVNARRLLRPIGVLLLAMAILAVFAGIAGYQLADRGIIRLNPTLARRVPREKQTLFLADGAAHLASYAGGFLGGAVLCCWIWRTRLRTPVENPGRGGEATG
jgi:hypothetical protein